MRVLVAASVCVLLSTPAFAQRGTPPPATDRTKARLYVGGRSG